MIYIKEGYDMRKIIGLSAFFITGVGLLASSIISNFNIASVGLIAFLSVFFVLGLSDHFKELI